MEGLCRSIGGCPKGQGESLLFPAGSHGTSELFLCSLYFLSGIFVFFLLFSSGNLICFTLQFWGLEIWDLYVLLLLVFGLVGSINKSGTKSEHSDV